MNIKNELAKIKPGKDTWFTVGVFDGVHVGHQQLLAYLRNKAKAQDCLSGVITFRSHPEAVISAASQPWIHDLVTRVDLIKGLGIDIVVILDFTEDLMQMDAVDFMQLLKKNLRLKGLVIGPDFALGKNREGGIERLKKLGGEMDFAVEAIEPFKVKGEVVSSSNIRQLVVKGDVKKAASFLGRFFRVSGKPVLGDHRGTALGFPTLNLEPRPDMVTPADGIYATLAHVNRKQFQSVTNIGTRPTFGSGKRLIETYLIDFKWRSRVKSVDVDFVERLRDELRFESTEALKAQIIKDVGKAILILKNYQE